MSPSAASLRHPHFDDEILVWNDEYSGRYEAPPSGYDDEFEVKWRLALDRDDFNQGPGARVDDEYIKDRVLEWTGRRPGTSGDEKATLADALGGVKPLDKPIPADLIRGKECIDIACGLGRWTRTMQMIGAASVVSVDISESALQSVSRFNNLVYKADLLTLTEEHPEWKRRFDFANLWGVVMFAHDPLKAFLQAASTVKPGGALFMMVYSPEGHHNSRLVNHQRRTFHGLPTIEDRLRYVEQVHSRRWDREYRLADNLRNLSIRLYRAATGRQGAAKVSVLDMLKPFYNWVIPLSVVNGWIQKAGFRKFEVLNEGRARVAYHILAYR